MADRYVLFASGIGGLLEDAADLLEDQVGEIEALADYAVVFVLARYAFRITKAARVLIKGEEGTAVGGGVLATAADPIAAVALIHTLVGLAQRMIAINGISGLLLITPPHGVDPPVK